MTTSIKATFEVTNWNEEPFDERDDAAKLTTASVTKSYAGDIEGDSATEWLMAYAADDSATFIGLERIAGAVAGRSGSFVLRHAGVYENGAATAELTVVDGCGTGDFEGVTGTGDFVADPSGKVELELTFP